LTRDEIVLIRVKIKARIYKPILQGSGKTNKEMRLCTKPKLHTGIGFGGEPIRARVTV